MQEDEAQLRNVFKRCSKKFHQLHPFQFKLSFGSDKIVTETPFDSCLCVLHFVLRLMIRNLVRPFDLFVLTTEGKHSPDGRQHLLCNRSSFGIGTLLFGGEVR